MHATYGPQVELLRGLLELLALGAEPLVGLTKLLGLAEQFQAVFERNIFLMLFFVALLIELSLGVVMIARLPVDAQNIFAAVQIDRGRVWLDQIA